MFVETCIRLYNYFKKFRGAFQICQNTSYLNLYTEQARNVGAVTTKLLN